MGDLKTSADFQSGYDAGSKALRLVLASAENEIKRLEAENAKMRAVLEDIADGDAFGSIWRDDARAALGQREDSK